MNINYEYNFFSNQCFKKYVAVDFLSITEMMIREIIYNKKENGYFLFIVALIKYLNNKIQYNIYGNRYTSLIFIHFFYVSVC